MDNVLFFPQSLLHSFDELNYGRYAQMYSKRQFFFDIHPPLGKMMLGAVGVLAGFDLNFNFDTIGSGRCLWNLKGNCNMSQIPLWAVKPSVLHYTVDSHQHFSMCRQPSVLHYVQPNVANCRCRAGFQGWHHVIATSLVGQLPLHWHTLTEVSDQGL